MADDLDRILVDLYPPELISRSRFFGKNQFSSTPYLELFCRHFQTCIQLANTVMEQTDWVRALQGAMGIARAPLELSDDESQGSEEGMELLGDVPLVEEVSFEPEELRSVIQDIEYEFIVLECSDESTFLQNKYVNDFLVSRGSHHISSGINRLFDIVWKKGKKLIEVKVSTNIKARRDEFLKQISVYPRTVISLCAFVAFSNNGKEYELININKEDLPGFNNAMLFLQRRFEKMADLGIVNEEPEGVRPFNFREGTISFSVFNEIVLFNQANECIKTLKEAEIEPTTRINPKRLNEILEKKPFPVLHHVMPQDISDLMIDFVHLDAPECKINAVLIPHHKCAPLVLEDKFKDKKVLTDICKYIQQLIPDVSVENELYTSMCEVLREVLEGRFSKNTTPNVLAATGKKFIEKVECWDYEHFPSLILSLGVGAKKTIKTDVYSPNMRQKVPSKRPVCRYPSYFNDLMEEFTENSGMTAPGDSWNEWESLVTNHPFDEGNKIGGQLIYNCIRTKRVFFEKQMYQRLYSQIAGGITDGPAERSNLSSFNIYPILNNFIVRKKKLTYVNSKVYGFCVRGPNHSKSANDRVPIFIVMLVKHSKMLNSFKGYEYFPTRLKEVLVAIRKTSVSKEGLSFKMFLDNTFLLPASNLHQVATSIASARTTIDRGQWIEVVRNSFEFSGMHLVDRCVESLVVALYSTPQYEGTVALLRKILLMMHVWKLEKTISREDSSVLHKNIRGLVIDKLNVQLIDDPVAFYFYEEIRRALLSYHPGVGFVF